MYDKQKVIDWALGEVGYHEGPNNWNKYAEYLDSVPGFYNGAKQNQPYCDIFVDAGFVHCYGVVGAKDLLCQPDYSCGAGCLYSAGYFRSRGRFHESNPQPGDQIFFSYKEGEVSHTGIVVEVTGYSVVTVEGNTSDMVAKRSYPLSDARIYGYGRPDWGEEEEPQEGQGVIIPPGPYEGHPDPVGEKGPRGAILVGEIPWLRQGDKGEVVRAAQFLLNGRGASCGRYGADGDFGPATYGAVYAFQHRSGLEADGIIGPNTWAKLLGVT